MGNIAFTLENLEYLYIKYLKQYKQFLHVLFSAVFQNFSFIIKPLIYPTSSKLNPPQPLWHNNHSNILYLLYR